MATNPDRFIDMSLLRSMDTTTLRTINDLQHPHYFSTLGNQSYFSSLSIPKERTHILDWWQTRIITLALPKMNGKANETIETSFELTCTPAQHHTSRGLFDQSKTLWAGFVLSSLPELSDKEFTVYFTGDTGYRYVPDGSNERDAPVCPIFKELGDKFGGFDLALLPIGYAPFNYVSLILPFDLSHLNRLILEPIYRENICPRSTRHPATVFRYSKISEQDGQLQCTGGSSHLFSPIYPFHPR